jgi:tetratricopeptide (TPR) repeat protein
LARIAALQKNPELAVQLFEKTLELRPDPDIASWSHVYLGRLFDLANERQPATDHYKAAVALEGAPPTAKQAARKGLEQSFEREKK